jgi:hypothetical protein
VSPKEDAAKHKSAQEKIDGAVSKTQSIKLRDVDALLVKYKGREYVLFKKIFHKYVEDEIEPSKLSNVDILLVQPLP